MGAATSASRAPIPSCWSIPRGSTASRRDTLIRRARAWCRPARAKAADDCHRARRARSQCSGTGRCWPCTNTVRRSTRPGDPRRPAPPRPRPPCRSATPVALRLQASFSTSVPPGARVTSTLSAPRPVALPLTAGATMGTLTYKVDGKQRGLSRLTAARSVPPASGRRGCGIACGAPGTTPEPRATGCSGAGGT